MAAWRTLTDAVHAAGGTIFAQIMHAGRIGHRDLTGLVPVAPSAVQAPGVTYTAEGPKEHDVPRELTDAEILGTIAGVAPPVAAVDPARVPPHGRPAAAGRAGRLPPGTRRALW